MPRMATPHLALLRGINVGGNNIIKMADLRTLFEELGYIRVRTYIQSGNILFDAAGSLSSITQTVEEALSARFSYLARVVVFTQEDYLAALKTAPESWGQKDDWKHNALFTLSETDPDEILQSLPAANPEYELARTGPRVLFWSASKEHLGKTSMMKLTRQSLYKSLTVRNYRTTLKLREILLP